MHQIKENENEIMRDEKKAECDVNGESEVPFCLPSHVCTNKMHMPNFM